MKNLLKKWLAGGATWEEEKNLRRAATKDDFLSEAMEGYDAFPNSNHSANIERLKGRLPNASATDNRRFFTLPRVAAAAAMVGVMSTFIWVQNQVEQPEVLSEHVEKLATPAPQKNTEPVTEKLQSIDNQIITTKEINPTIAKKEKTPQNKLANPKTNSPVKSKKIIQPTKTDFADMDNTADGLAESEMADIQLEETTISDASILTESVDIVPLPDNQPVGQVAESEPVATRSATPSRKEELPPSASNLSFAKSEQTSIPAKEQKSKARKVEKINYYVGQVQNEDGQPLHQVKVIGLNTKFKTSSKMSGDFILKTTEPLTQITVSKDGFHTRKILINQYTDFLNVSLVKKSTKIADDSSDMETIAPKPQEGFVNFFEYLSRNLTYPAAAGKAGIEREVEIRFMIDANGTPTDLKVVNPDQYGFDKEAVRLLQNGPKWVPTNSHARYFVSFELEK